MDLIIGFECDSSALMGYMKMMRCLLIVLTCAVFSKLHFYHVNLVPYPAEREDDVSGILYLELPLR